MDTLNKMKSISKNNLVISNADSWLLAHKVCKYLVIFIVHTGVLFQGDVSAAELPTTREPYTLLSASDRY